METLGGTARPFTLPPVAWLALLVSIVALAILTTGVAGEGPGPEDAGDDLSSATAVDAGVWTGTIFRNSTEEDLADFYEFTFQPGALVEAKARLEESSSIHLDVFFKVFDLEGSPVVSLSYPRLGANETFETLTRNDLEERSYYFALTWDGSSLLEYSINYTLWVNASEEAQDDAGAGLDAPSERQDAFSLALGNYSGRVGGSDADWDFDANADGIDMYKVTPEAGHFIKVTVTLERKSEVRSQNLVMALENSTGKVLDQVIVASIGEKESIRYLTQTVEGLYVNISSTALFANYSLVISIEVPGADGGGTSDAGDDVEHARTLTGPLMSGVIMRGTSAEDLVDFYELEFPASRFVEATFTLRLGTASTSNVLFTVLDHTKTEVVNFTLQGLDQPVRFASLTNSRYTTLRYFFSISWTGGEEVAFEFKYELATEVGEGQDDGGSGEDATNVTSGATTLSFDDPLTGTVGGTNPQWSDDQNADGADVYEVYPVSGKFVLVKAVLDGFEGQRRVGFDFHLEDQSGKLLVKPTSLFAVEDEAELRYYALETMPVYVVVTSESEACDYTLMASQEEPPDVDLKVESITLTPSRPDPNVEVTITIIVSSTNIIETATVVRVEVFAGGNKLAERDVIFDGTDKVAVNILWTVPSATTELSVKVDTLNAIPWETNEDNNEGSLNVVIGGDGDGDQDDNGGRDLMFWTFVLVGVIALSILVVVLYVVFGGHEAEDEEPEDY